MTSKMSARSALTDFDDAAGPPGDLLQQPFSRAGAAASLDFTELHRRYPSLAHFRAELGDTPLVEVPTVAGGARILAKQEWRNPVGSIKDRTAYALVADALREHGERPVDQLKLLAYSGGDLAAAMSLLAVRLGFTARFVLASYTPRSLLDLLAERGCLVDLVPKEFGFIRTIRIAQRIAVEDPSWTLVFQHANPMNVAVHEQLTGGEIVKQLQAIGVRPDRWIASIGSGGTLVGVLLALQAAFPDVRAIGVTPAESPYANPDPPSGRPTYEGSGGHGYGIRQPFVKAYEEQISEQRQITLPSAMAAMAEFFDLTGSRIGSSAAANWLVAKQCAERLPASASIVTVFPCAGTPEQWIELGRWH